MLGDFQCDTCSHAFEEFYTLATLRDAVPCPHCSSPATRRYHPPRVRRRRSEIEEVIAYRLRDGSISIPPDGGPSQDGGERISVRTLREADRLAAEVAEQQRKRFEDTGEFRERMEESMGKPTDHLYHQLSRTSSQLEKDVIRHMIEDLNEEQYRQEKPPESNAYFHWREYDR